MCYYNSVLDCYWTTELYKLISTGSDRSTFPWIVWKLVIYVYRHFPQPIRARVFLISGQSVVSWSDPQMCWWNAFNLICRSNCRSDLIWISWTAVWSPLVKRAIRVIVTYKNLTLIQLGLTRTDSVWTAVWNLEFTRSSAVAERPSDAMCCWNFF